ncbi:MAG: single-stranded-DNA-specific exonuclease RecJ [Lachnospiraceae bacterium]|nr:single-stranded-DNA-specific exonuclease RecJ [Lachnospiraceae bacterium]
MAKWVVSAKKAEFDKIGEKFHIDPVIARIIRNRDIEDDVRIERFLHGTLENLHSPYLLKDVEKAAAILQQKIEQGKTIRVIGDYDIDGICSTYILLTGLKACGANVDFVIPHRIHDGYGMNEHMIAEAHEAGIDTILTCDNGIAAAEQIAYAKSLDMTVVVTDHHEVPYEVREDGTRQEYPPPADAVIDPKQAQCGYPFEGICGAVVAYKLIQVLADRVLGEKKCDLLQELLAFAAFATVGDVMELVDENRIIVKYGLRQIAKSSNDGMQALLTVNRLQDKPLSAYHVGFVLGPCLNATGRLDTARRALQMFLTNDKAEAVTIAGELRELNDSRKDMTLQGTKQAISLIEESSLRDDKVLVVYLPDCHESLAGIIAGRIRERYHKPVFVLTRSEEGIKGSGRSIEAYHMYDKMSECKELYTKYGGHKMAAGVSMPEDNVEVFRDYLNEHCGLSAEDFEEKIYIDVPMPMSYVTTDLVRQLSVLEPFGNGNPKPVFAQRNLCLIRGRILGKNSNVGKYTVEDDCGRQFEMMYFGNMEMWHAFLVDEFGQEEYDRLYRSGGGNIRIHAIYYPEVDIYGGRERLQMIMQDYCKGDIV